MEESIFTILGKYKPSENVTPEENYSTELFVYLLNYSLRSKTELFSRFMELLDENISTSIYDDFSIGTQEGFSTITNNRIIPDIYIKRKTVEKYYFIEVKVESGLNFYKNVKNSKGTINQIQKYQKIKTSEKNIYLLTKYACGVSFDDCPDFKKKIRLHNIHEILKDYKSKNTVENFLISETIKYMEDNNMSIPKVSYELVKGMESLNNLLEQIEIALEEIPYKKSFTYEWLGYYLHVNKGENDGLVGTEYDGKLLFFEYLNKNAIKLIKEKYSNEFELSDNKAFYFHYFDFEKEYYFCLKPGEQFAKLKKWINSNYQRLVKYSK